MKTIDHRILIPAPPERVWEIVSDVSRNPDWQIDCREVIFLTSKREGPGLRWRYSDDRRREFVYEVSAWYAGYGYEYYFVDGPAFRDARGRIRLQEIPEGTIVQWTFSYETGGMLSGVGLHNALDRLMQDSLRQLWQMLKTGASVVTEHQPKSLMRDAPDVSARSTYQPRHPAADSRRSDSDSPAAPSQQASPTPLVSHRAYVPPETLEPSVTREDTRRNDAVASSRHSVADDEALIPGDFSEEPDFLNALEELTRFEPPPTAEATQPRRSSRPVDSAVPTRPVEAASISQPPAVDEPYMPPATPAAQPIQETAHVVPEGASIGTINEPESSSLEDTNPVASVTAPEPASEVVSPPVTSEKDARSIWEIFNVPRPSETGEVDAVPAPSTEPEPPVSSLPVLDSSPSAGVQLDVGTRGLRQTIRRKTVRIRRPS